MNKPITLTDIAGYCTEDAIWRMVVELGQSIKDNNHCPLSPDEIIVDGMSFLTNGKSDRQLHMLAPEYSNDKPYGTPQQVWTLGALIYYASSGRTLFGGHGGAYQKNHPNVLLPSLRKSHGALTELMQQCLRHDPSTRIGIDKLIEEARKGLENCLKTQRSRCQVAEDTLPPSDRQIKESWPEEMKEMI